MCTGKKSVTYYSNGPQSFINIFIFQQHWPPLNAQLLQLLLPHEDEASGHTRVDGHGTLKKISDIFYIENQFFGE